MLLGEDRRYDNFMNNIETQTKIDIKKNITRILLLGIVASYLLNPIFNGNLGFLIFLFGMSILFISIPTMGRGSQIPTLIFLAAGLLLIIVFRLPFSSLVKGASSMANLISILVALQLFAAPVKVGDYGPAIERIIAQYSKKEKHLFIIVTLLSFVFTSFLLMGSVPVIMALLGTAIAKNVQDKKRFASAAITRGYTAALMWSPGAVIMLLTLQATNTKWTQVFPFSFLLSIIAILSSHVLESRLVLRNRPVKSNTAGNTEHLPSLKKSWWQMSQILTVVIAIVLGIYLFDMFTNLSATHCVIFTGLLIICIWMISLMKKSGKKAALADYWKNELLKSQGIASMFIAIGIFAQAVQDSGVISYIMPFLTRAVSYKYFFLALLPAIILLLSIIGIHSFISIAVIGNVLASLSLPFSMVPVAVAMLAGSALSFSLSPYAGLTLTMSKFIDSSPFDISIKWNGIYSAVIYVEAVLLIWILVLIGV